MNITPNLFIELEDIQVNRELWNQKINIIEFKDKKGKTYWNKESNFIPTWKRYKEAKDWIKNTEFPDYDCKIAWNSNESIEIVTQNYFGTIIAHEQNIKWIIRKIHQKIHSQINSLDLEEENNILIKQDLETILGFKTYQEFNNSPYNYLYQKELEDLKLAESKKGKLSGKDLGKQAYDLNRTDLAILWRKQLYFIKSWEYIDNYTLFVQIKAFKCPLSISYPTWLNTSGAGTLEKGNIIKDYSDRPILNGKGQKILSGHRFHFDFCEDLGIKRVWQQPVLSYQPDFAFFYAAKEGIRGINLIKKDDLVFPIDAKLTKLPLNVKEEDFKRTADFAKVENVLGGIPKTKFNPMAFISNLVTQLLKDSYYFTIGPSEKNNDSGLWHTSHEKEEILFSKKDGTSNSEMERMFSEQPHLWDHTTFQFFLFNNLTMTANGRHLGIVEKDGKFILPYKLFINFSPGNLYYRWEFEYITVKCEISVGFEFRDAGNPAALLTGTHIRIATFGGGIDWNLNDRPDIKENTKKAKKAAAKQEARDEKRIKDSYKETLNRTMDPIMQNAHTKDFNYSIGEFFNRFADPVFTIRMNISELLYNNLTWANNKTITPELPFSWEELGSWTQKPGIYKWKDVYLEDDYQGFWKQKMEQGYLLTSGEELKNPKLNYHRMKNYIALGDNSWSVSFAEEETVAKEVIEEYEEEVGSFNRGDAHVSFVTYFRTDDDNLYNQIATNINGHQTGVRKTVRQSGYIPSNNSVDNINAFCWGCVIRDAEIPISQGGTVYTFFNQRQGTEEVMEIPNDCALIIDTGKGEFRVKSKRTRMEYSTKLKSSTQTSNQEIDQDLLESEEIEAGEIIIEQENTEEIIKELGVGQEKETIEPEKEGETEKEKEKETEGEQEKETEKEKETETEKEKEKEKESEQEKLERERLEREETERKEQERKENEGEGEN